MNKLKDNETFKLFFSAASTSAHTNTLFPCEFLSFKQLQCKCETKFTRIGAT